MYVCAVHIESERERKLKKLSHHRLDVPLDIRLFFSSLVISNQHRADDEKVKDQDEKELKIQVT